MKRRLCAAVLMTSGCLPVAVTHVDEAARGPARDPETVAIYGDGIGMPSRRGRTVASLSVRRPVDLAFGFTHLRSLRRAAAGLGCDAIIVEAEELEADDVRCGRHHTEPVPCIARYDATCVRFD